MRRLLLLALMFGWLVTAVGGSHALQAQSSPPATPVAFIFIDFGAHWCTPCINFKRDVLDDASTRVKVDEVYAMVLTIDVDLQAGNPARRLLIDAYQPGKSIPQVVVVGFDQPIPPSLLSNDNDLTLEQANFIVSKGKRHAVKSGYVSERKEFYVQWLLHPATQQDEILPQVKEAETAALVAAYELAQAYAFEAAKPFWRIIKETKDESLKKDSRWQFVALNVGSRDGDTEIAKQAGKDMVKAGYVFGKYWLCDALEADPSLRLLAIRTYASSTESVEQKRDVYECAADSALKEKNIIIAEEYFRKTVGFQFQLVDEDGKYLAEHVQLAYYLSRYDVLQALDYLETLATEHPFVSANEQADYLEEIELFDDAIVMRLRAIKALGPDATVSRAQQYSRLARDYYQLGQNQAAIAALQESIKLIKSLIDSPEANRPGQKPSEAKAKWEKWIEDYNKRVKEYQEASGAK